MQLSFYKEQPLHQVLLNWLPWTTSRKPSNLVDTGSIDGSIDMTGRMQATAASQLVMSLRMQGVEPEDETMLHSLEALMLAGEITFKDFTSRVQNLFPRAMEALDVSMRMKIASLALISAPMAAA